MITYSYFTWKLWKFYFNPGVSRDQQSKSVEETRGKKFKFPEQEQFYL